MKFRVLYLFSSDRLLLFEIKRLGLPATAKPHQLYHWFQYQPHTRQLTRLDFKSMSSNPPFEVREFEQGSLRFSDIEGVYQPATAGAPPVALHRDFLPELPASVAEQLQQLELP